MKKIKEQFYVNAINYNHLEGEDKVFAEKIFELLSDDLELMSLHEGCFVNFITKHPKYKVSIQSDYSDELTSKFFIAFSKARQKKSNS